MIGNMWAIMTALMGSPLIWTLVLIGSLLLGARTVSTWLHR